MRGGIIAIVLCCALHGCGFIYFPLPTSDSTAAGNTCVPDGYRVGKRLKNDNGQIGTVKALHGRHQRCQVAEYPILATVEYD